MASFAGSAIGRGRRGARRRRGVGGLHRSEEGAGAGAGAGRECGGLRCWSRGLLLPGRRRAQTRPRARSSDVFIDESFTRSWVS